MKVTLCVILFSAVQIFASDGYSQDIRFTLTKANSAIEDVLNVIEDQSDYYFLYNGKLVDVTQRVNIKIENQDIGKTLDELLRNTNITYKIYNRQVVLSPAEVQISIQQVREVSGKVTDPSGTALPGVTIVIKGTATGIISDIDGKYTLSNVSDDSVIQFSFVGMKTQEVMIGSKTEINIVMEEETIGIEEVVTIGYGTVKRKDFTGSVGSLKIEDSPVALLPNLNVFESIKGNIAGINIGVTNTAGADPAISIRGQNSISGSNAPLIVLDGLIYSGSLVDINSNDIEKIDVLKDAASAAVYGSRSSNGIIFITTKKGKSLKPTITLHTSTALQHWQNKPDMMNGTQYIEKVNAYSRYAEGSTYWMIPIMLERYNANEEVDWVNEISRTGTVENYDLAVSGNNKDNFNYYMSFSYAGNKGIIIGDDFKKISGLAKLNTTITSWLQIGVDASFTKKDYSGIAANLSNAQYMPPYAPMYRDDLGNLEKYPREQSLINPLWGVSDGLIDNYEVGHNYRLYSYALLTAPWIKGLTYRFNYQTNKNLRETRNFYKEGYYVREGSISDVTRYQPSTIQGFLQDANGAFDLYAENSYILDNILNYRQTFAKHNVDVTLVATRDHSMSEIKSQTGSDFTSLGSTALGYWGLHLASIQKINLNVSEYSNIGYLGRISYSFNDKYFITGSLRRDGSSVFGEGKKWGNFRAISLGWKISNEDFFKGITPLNDLKLKLSFGQNGNQGVGAYSSISTVLTGRPSGISYVFSNTGSQIYYGLSQLNLSNSLLGWESTEKVNAGFESAWINRIFFDFDFYFSKTRDEIYNQSIPSMTGFTQIKSSLGEVQNYGVELTLRTINLKNKDWNWSTNISYWFNRNKLLKLTGLDLDQDGKEDDQIDAGMFIGKPLNSIYGYVQDGIVQSDDVQYKAMEGAAIEDGYPKYKDISNDGKIGVADRQILGYPQPNFTLNMSNTVSYKNFELYVMVAGIFGGNNYYLKSNTPAYVFPAATWVYNYMNIPYWTAESRSNKYPAAFFHGEGQFLGLQSRSFVRIQNISLSYTFSRNWLKKINLNSLKLFCTANNPLIITNWVGGDPEVGDTYVSGSLPVPSTYSFGVNVSF